MASVMALGIYTGMLIAPATFAITAVSGADGVLRFLSLVISCSLTSMLIGFVSTPELGFPASELSATATYLIATSVIAFGFSRLSTSQIVAGTGLAVPLCLAGLSYIEQRRRAGSYALNH
jgi:hypothetical protein